MGKYVRSPIAITLLYAATAASGNAKQPIDWTVYPEMSKERALPLIVDALRYTLFDPGSVTNFMICYPPVQIKMKNGRPVRWTVTLSLNSKNRYGGYAGNQAVAAVFSSDKPVWTFSLAYPLSAKDLANCTRVPDAEVQRLLRGE